MKDPTADLLSIYVRKNIFEEKRQKGFTKFSFGQNNETDSHMITLWAFFHPKGSICTYEFHKNIAQEGVMHHTPFGANYSPKTFRDYIAKHRVILSPRKELVAFLDNRYTHAVPQIKKETCDA